MLSLGGAASALANATNRHIALSCTRRCTPAGVHATHAAGNRVSTAAESSVFVFREGVSATRESVSGFCATEVSVARSRGPRSGSCHTTTGRAPGCGSSTCSAATFSSSAPDPPATPSLPRSAARLDAVQARSTRSRPRAVHHAQRERRQRAPPARIQARADSRLPEICLSARACRMAATGGTRERSGARGRRAALLPPVGGGR